MTRGMVKSRLKYESMVGNPQPSVQCLFKIKACSSSTKWELAFYSVVIRGLRYSQASFERMQNNKLCNDNLIKYELAFMN